LDWYYRTQVRSDDPHSFKWKGRTLTHWLASGLDDFTRNTFLSDREGHLDMHSWMTFAYQTMGRIAAFLGKIGDAEEYRLMARSLLDKIDEAHWDDRVKLLIMLCILKPSKLSVAIILDTLRCYRLC